MKIFGSVIYIVLKDILTVYNIFNRMDYYYYYMEPVYSTGGGVLLGFLLFDLVRFQLS